MVREGAVHQTAAIVDGVDPEARRWVRGQTIGEIQ